MLCFSGMKPVFCDTANASSASTGLRNCLADGLKKKIDRACICMQVLWQIPEKLLLLHIWPYFVESQRSLLRLEGPNNVPIFSQINSVYTLLPHFFKSFYYCHTHG